MVFLGFRESGSDSFHQVGESQVDMGIMEGLTSFCEECKGHFYLCLHLYLHLYFVSMAKRNVKIPRSLAVILHSLSSLFHHLVVFVFVFWLVSSIFMIVFIDFIVSIVFIKTKFYHRHHGWFTKLFLFASPAPSGCLSGGSSLVVCGAR